MISFTRKSTSSWMLAAITVSLPCEKGTEQSRRGIVRGKRYVALLHSTPCFGNTLVRLKKNAMESLCSSYEYKRLTRYTRFHRPSRHAHGPSSSSFSLLLQRARWAKKNWHTHWHGTSSVRVWHLKLSISPPRAGGFHKKRKKKKK